MAGARERIAGAVGWPARRLLDPRVHWVVSLVEDRLGRHPTTVHDRLGELDRLARAQLAAVGFLRLDEGEQPGRALADLDAPTAATLNWATGPDGYAAQAGAWFNPPVPAEYRPGVVGALLVNERIVEQPFVFAALGPADPPLRVLDVGGAESTVGLSLATLGHHVTLVDPRGFPAELHHPNLRTDPVRLEQHALPAEGYDVAVALSAVEHFGLGHYGATAPQEDDRSALRFLSRAVKPGGRLVLTVPFGPVAGQDDFQRVYDEPGLRALLAGWTIERLDVAWRTDRTRWTMGTPDAPQGSVGAALVLARRPAGRS